MRIEEINGDEVIYMRRTGQYGEENYELMCKMKAWSNERGLLTDDAVLFGIALDNPQFTKPSECRYDVCLLASSAKRYRSRRPSRDPEPLRGQICSLHHQPH
jgi:DNA gyrase inhibitor